MTEEEFKERTKGVALRVIKLTETLPNRRTVDVLARQMLRSATSIGANYRAACRSRSTADMISRLSIAEEEVSLTSEIEEILKMTVASIKTLRHRPIQNPKSKI